MIVTHTQNAKGQTRLYLGGKSSIECYIAPNADGRSWSFHMDASVAGTPLSRGDQRATCVHLLQKLADMLGVAPEDLMSVPFEVIAGLHTANPLESRRVAMPRKKTIENGFIATPPNVTRPSHDFHTADFDKLRSRCP